MPANTRRRPQAQAEQYMEPPSEPDQNDEAEGPLDVEEDGMDDGDADEEADEDDQLGKASFLSERIYINFCSPSSASVVFCNFALASSWSLRSIFTIFAAAV
ncbi:hypothetical protein NA57DRAFT_51194 [Rhizodiscina lignyota]|uniref:Uncharacterized protein n=1 Tax=Rhizodiscina lignyota TaxID=1504668 RepID=A0A9P4IQP8_9PEZI|nr:hypothetical protein NA57DRAFT_51194 [Rhizodiscina lignyota]